MKRTHFLALLLSSALAVSMTGCAPKDEQPVSIPTDGDSVSIGTTVRYAPGTLTLSAENNYPYLGMRFSAPEDLRSAIEAGELFVDADGAFQVLQNEDGTYVENAPLDYGYLLFTVIPEVQRARTPRTDSPESITDYDTFTQWLAEDTVPLGRISVFSSSCLDGKEVSELTGMETNVELVQIGNYHFYFSCSEPKTELSEADLNLAASLADDVIALLQTLAVREPRNPDENYAGFTTPEQMQPDQVGDFQTTDLDGNEVTSDIFQDYDLTMINIWTTWCSPCLQELPHLAELAEEMNEQGVQIISIVHDVVDPTTGEINEEQLELAKLIRERAKVSYPILLPDEVLREGILNGIPGYPETYFVDRDGNLVTEPLLGAKSKQAWKQTIEEALSLVKE